jgi:2-polyprenyl-6-methoxyphenol hydroxylase-like FAD-dependent oxidoreductase
MATDVERLSCTCVVAGGGPAGIVAGFLLARAGVDVIVLEKHADFFRDFRGDTIHASTTEVMAELNLLDAFLAVPHQEARFAEGMVDEERFRVADFTHLPTRCKFIAMMPQWDFLTFLASQGRRYPSFRLMMSTEATDLTKDSSGAVVGVIAQSSADGASSRRIEINARLVIAADGRHSRLRQAAGLAVQDLGAPMDVLWFKLAAGERRDHAVLGRIDAGQVLVMLDRGTYFQCALVIPKGAADAVKREGLAAFRARVTRLAGRDSANEIENLDEVKLLTVAVDRLATWCRPGLLFIGDAAHTMSPIGGVGINLAIQDAVAASNILAADLRHGEVSLAMLQRVQRRRWFPTWATQRMQIAIQNNAISPILRADAAPRVPSAVRFLTRQSWFQRLAGRIVGLGFRPEHVHTAEWRGTA